MKTQQNKKIEKLLMSQGYKTTLENIARISAAIEQAEQEQGEKVSDIYLEYGWQDSESPLCVCFRGSSYRNIYFDPGLEKENNIKNLLRNIILSFKDDLYKSVNINRFLIGEILTNKPAKLQQFNDEQERNGLFVDFIAYNPDCYYIFKSFEMVDGKARKSSISCRHIDNDSRTTANEQARKDAQRIFYILSESKYFTEITNKEQQRRGNEWGYIHSKRELNFSIDRLTDKYIIANRSTSWDGSHENTTRHSLGGYSWGKDEQPTDKSGYFLPYFREKLQRRLCDYKKKTALLRYQEIDKAPYISELNKIKFAIKCAIDPLLENYQSLYFCDCYLDGIKTLTNILKDCDIDLEKYQTIDRLQSDINELKARAEKATFFYNIERIKKYNYSCLHQYQKVEDHYEMIEKYKNDSLWGKYAQVIY